MYNGYGAETGMAGVPQFEAFSEKSVRMAFIRKVYSIVCCQLIVTMAFILAFSLSDPLKGFLFRNSWIMIVAVIGVFASLITLVCCGIDRSYPYNLIVLGIFTLFESLLLSFLAASSSNKAVLYAVIVTTVIVVGLTLFAFQTKIDFTVFSGIMFVILMVFTLFGFIAMFFPASRTLNLVYSGLGALIFSCYLVIDTQLIVGGNHSRQFSPEEYVVAAVTIYTDIINIFIYVLSIINQMTKD